MGTAPYGKDARFWTWQSGLVSIAAANQRQKVFPGGRGRPVEAWTVQAAVANVDVVTIGDGTVALNVGIRQLLPGEPFSIVLAEGVPIQSGQIAQTPAVLTHPVELIDFGRLFVHSATANQVLMWTMFYRQPSA